MVEFVSYIISAILTFLAGIAVWNIVYLKNKKYNNIEIYPSLSVLIPARNEEKNISNCILSLLNQDYHDFEVIVLDDNSNDSTIHILNEIKVKFPELKILKGKPLLNGWTGKNYACHQLYKEAKGEILLFTDADTIHKPNGLKKSVSAMIYSKADLYTLLPEMTLKSFSEKILMPLLHFTAFMMLPFYMAENSKYPIFALGAGPFMMFRRSSYEKAGGHYEVRNDIVEDIRLAKNIKRNNLKVVTGKGNDILSVRMYSDFIEIWNGFSKNIYPAMSYSPFTLISVVFFYLFAYVSPYALIIYGLFAGSNILISMSFYQILVLVLSGVLINKFFKLPQISVLMHPFSISIVILIALNSLKWNAFGKGSLWKERVYPEKIFKKNIIINSKGK